MRVVRHGTGYDGLSDKLQYPSINAYAHAETRTMSMEKHKTMWQRNPGADKEPAMSELKLAK